MSPILFIIIQQKICWNINCFINFHNTKPGQTDFVEWIHRHDFFHMELLQLLGVCGERFKLGINKRGQQGPPVGSYNVVGKLVRNQWELLPHSELEYKQKRNNQEVPDCRYYYYYYFICHNSTKQNTRHYTPWWARDNKSKYILWSVDLLSHIWGTQ